MRSLFVTASGTGVGKTLLACLLIADLQRRGVAIRALKPVATGFDPDDAAASDPGRLLAALGRRVEPAQLDRISPWRFRAPLSPDMAATRERRAIPFAELVEFCLAGAAEDVTIIEGIGGVMVPLDAKHTVLDWIAALSSPAVLVTGSDLGAISHTLTALAALRHRGVPVRGLLISESTEQSVPLDETARTIERHADGVPVHTLPRRVDTASLPPGFAEQLFGDALAR